MNFYDELPEHPEPMPRWHGAFIAFAGAAVAFAMGSAILSATGSAADQRSHQADLPVPVSSQDDVPEAAKSRARMIEDPCGPIMESVADLGAVLEEAGFQYGDQIPVEFDDLIADRIQCRASGPPASVDAFYASFVSPAGDEMGTWLLLADDPADGLSKRSKEIVQQVSSQVPYDFEILWFDAGAAIVRIDSDLARDLTDALRSADNHGHNYIPLAEFMR